MKTTKTLITLLAGALLGSAAYGQVEVTITGSTAFRAITIDRSASLYDGPSRTAITNDAATGLITFSGTMSNSVPSLGATPVKIRLSFSGSASGMLAVKNQTPVSTADTQGGNITKVPDLALSDVFPESATPSILRSVFDRDVLGVIPFLWVKNSAMAGVNNVTRDQALLLMTASGGMPATYLGGTSPDPIYLIGRDSGSGTRISVEKDIGFVGSPLLWGTDGSGNYIINGGLVILGARTLRRSPRARRR